MSVFQSPTVTVQRDGDGSFVLVMDVPDRSVNVITRQVLADLEAALDALAAQPRVPVLVVRSGKKSGFLAGADISEFLGITDAAAARALSEAGQKVFDRLANLAAPSVAVIHGACLGGGLELALACDYRLIFDKPGTQLGLPEVELGLLPAWGGTQRLPRVIGLERALKVILAGKRLDAREAYSWGLSDSCPGNEAELRDQFAKLLVRAVAHGKQKREKLPLRGWRQRMLESNAFGRGLILKGTQRLIRNRVPDDMPAPHEALEAVRLGISRGIQAGLAQEREAASRLAVSPACRNLVTLFLQREKARKFPADLPEVPAVRKLGVVGAGVMGAGIIQLAALRGCEVVVQEINEAALAAGLARVDELFGKAIERRVISAEEAKQRRAAVRGTVSWEGFSSIELVIEAAVEDLEVKRGLFREMEARTGAATVLATNTSSITVASLQGGLAHPERVGGLHFFNPVHKMPLVEVVEVPGMDSRAVAVLMRFGIDVGKTPVRVGDGPGFVVNRILMPYLDEAVRLVGEGLKIKDVDRLMRKFGMPMGPLELLDQIGLDVAAHVADLVRSQLGEQVQADLVFAELKRNGWLGQKSGQGFYIHKGRSPKVNKGAQQVVVQASPAPIDKRSERSSLTLDDRSLRVNLPKEARLADARERMVLLMVNEAARVLERGLADADTIDLAMVFGTGWAPHRGGPLRYADTRGIDDVVRSLTSLATRLGSRFDPCAELKRRAPANELFRAGR
jgi:3-hydroxyacyl-CoA dehydrogenase/enoyl-CoA hydratase/3-hydroxybutyryl-CoA epimerase